MLYERITLQNQISDNKVKFTETYIFKNKISFTEVYKMNVDQDLRGIEWTYTVDLKAGTLKIEGGCYVPTYILKDLTDDWLKDFQVKNEELKNEKRASTL